MNQLLEAVISLQVLDKDSLTVRSWNCGNGDDLRKTAGDSQRTEESPKSALHRQEIQRPHALSHHDPGYDSPEFYLGMFLRLNTCDHQDSRGLALISDA
jgi:hypothetical protein